MSDYGVFANIVATAGTLAAAAAAITLAFQKRSRWQPPEESVPAGVSRVSALIAMIFIAIIYMFARSLGPGLLAILSVVCVIAAVGALMVAIYVNTTFSFHYPSDAEADRKLGGNILTEEAARIKKEKQLTEKQLFIDAQGDKDLVWTKASQSSIQIKSALSFIGLIAFGTCALAAVSVLVATFIPA
jgi:hypothetical protein